MNLRFNTMDKPKVVAAIAVTAAVLAVSGSVMLTRPSVAADKANLKKQPAAAGMPDMEAMRAKMLEQTAAELGLTASQKEQFQAAQEQAETSRRALFGNKSLSREQTGERMRQSRSEDEARIRAILTPEQQSKYEQMQEKRRAEWAKRREQGPGGRGFAGAAPGGRAPGGMRGMMGMMGGPPPGGMPPDSGPPPEGVMGSPPPDGFGPPPDGNGPPPGRSNGGNPPSGSGY